MGLLFGWCRQGLAVGMDCRSGEGLFNMRDLVVEVGCVDVRVRGGM